MIDNKVTYNPRDNKEWFQEILSKATTIDKGLIRVEGKVVKDIRMFQLVDSDVDILQADDLDCGWSATEVGEAKSKTMSVKPWKVNLEKCKQELDSIANVGDEMVDSLLSKIQTMAIQKMGVSIEKKIWGNASGDDTIITKALADTDVVKVDGVTLTKDNVYSEFLKLYNAIPEKVLNDVNYDSTNGKVIVFVSPKTFRLLAMNSVNLESGSQVVYQPFGYNPQTKTMTFAEVEIHPVLIADDMMFAASYQNIVFLTDMLDETTEIKFAQGTELKNEDIFYGKANMKAGSDYIFGGELALYRIKPVQP